ncbi:MAG: tail fiber protein [Blastocatellia bacterium]|nr:tail fiber protein [Blastocatellia bacterium]
MATPYVGEIRMFGGNFAPLNWAFCDGSLLPISEYDTLFALIGTTYGGDGQTTFALPDLRGRIPVSQGQGPGLSPYMLGQAGGSEQVTLVQGQLPAHTHTALASVQSGNSGGPAGHTWAAITTLTPYSTDATQVQPMAAGAVGQVGGSQPHDNLMPYLAVNFIIALYGVFPTQS